MPIISIDLSKLAGEVLRALPSEGDVNRFRRSLGDEARLEWIRLGQQLKSTSRDYVQGIQKPESGDSAVTVSLVGTLPNMVENGWGKHDLRQTVIPNAKTKKRSKAGHFYVSVPFRHGSSGTGGVNVGRPMPRAIQQVAKALEASLSRPGGGTKYGDRLAVDSKMGPKARKILQSKEKPWHSTSIYTSMIRQAETYQSATQSSYKTWRTISENVSAGPQHWIHPGIQARGYARNVQSYLGKVLGVTVERSLKGGR